MKFIVEINNPEGAFQILLFDTKEAQQKFINAINKNIRLTAYDRGCVNLD